MLPSLLSVHQVNRDGKNSIEIKYANTTSLVVIFLLRFLIAIPIVYIFIYFVIPEWRNSPINILTLLLPIAVFLSFLNAYLRLKKASIVLSKDDDYLYFDRFMSKNEKAVQKIPINESIKIIVCKNPNILYFYNNLLVESGQDLYLLSPIVQNLPKNPTPKFGSDERPLINNFCYTDKNIEMISNFIGCPVKEEKSLFGFRAYVYNFLKNH